MVKKGDDSNVTSAEILETVKNVEKATKKDLKPVANAVKDFNTKWKIKDK